MDLSGNTTKVMYVRKAEREWQVSQYLEKYDPEGYYGVYAVENFRVTSDMFRGESPRDRRTCNGLFNIRKNSDLEKLHAVSYPYYTYDLARVIQDKKLSVDVVRYGLSHIWQCLQFMHSHYAVHGDIKSNNIAYRKQSQDFVFSDWGWGGIVNSPESILEQYQRYGKIRKGSLAAWYPKEIKTFHATTTKDMFKIIKYVDVYGLMRITVQVAKAFRLRELNSLLHFQTKLNFRTYKTTTQLTEFMVRLFE